MCDCLLQSSPGIKHIPVKPCYVATSVLEVGWDSSHPFNLISVLYLYSGCLFSYYG